MGHEGCYRDDGGELLYKENGLRKRVKMFLKFTYIENEFQAYQIPPGNLSTKIIKSASMMRVALQGNINEVNYSSDGSLKLRESLALNIRCKENCLASST